MLVLHIFLFRYSHFFQLYKDMYVEFTGASKLSAGVNGCIISSVRPVLNIGPENCVCAHSRSCHPKMQNQTLSCKEAKLCESFKQFCAETHQNLSSFLKNIDITSSRIKKKRNHLTCY